MRDNIYWAGRDNKGVWGDCTISMWTREPTIDRYGRYISQTLGSDAFVREICYKKWIKDTGVSIKPGQKKQIKITFEAIESNAAGANK